MIEFMPLYWCLAPGVRLPQDLWPLSRSTPKSTAQRAQSNAHAAAGAPARALTCTHEHSCCPSGHGVQRFCSTGDAYAVVVVAAPFAAQRSVGVTPSGRQLLGLGAQTQADRPER